MLQDDFIGRQIRAFIAAVMRIKNAGEKKPEETLGDLGELFQESFGLKASIALALEPAALVAVLSPGGAFDKLHAGLLVEMLRLQLDVGASSPRHRAQIDALLAAGAHLDFAAVD